MKKILVFFCLLSFYATSVFALSVNISNDLTNKVGLAWVPIYYSIGQDYNSLVRPGSILSGTRAASEYELLVLMESYGITSYGSGSYADDRVLNDFYKDLYYESYSGYLPRYFTVSGVFGDIQTINGIDYVQSFSVVKKENDFNYFSYGGSVNTSFGFGGSGVWAVLGEELVPPNPVPEPSTYLLLGSGLLGLIGYRRFKK